MPDRLTDIGRSDRFGQRQHVAGGREFSGRKARQGRIVLNTPLRRAIFVGGLVIAVIGAFMLGYLA